MKQARLRPWLGVLALGLLVVMASCLSAPTQGEITTSSATDDPDSVAGGVFASPVPASSATAEGDSAATDVATSPVSPLPTKDALDPATTDVTASPVAALPMTDDQDSAATRATASPIPALPTADNPDSDTRDTDDSPALAFPTAEGFGANSIGGRGGQVIEVTNLNDSGPGSLRAALEAKGPRIVVFRTGGTIELQSGLLITNPYVTIAGQTAPGGGITLKNHPSNTQAALTIKAHDVIIRYIRSRPGASTQPACCLGAIQILTASAYNVIIDHSSASWATDENVSTWYDPYDITIQWSIISEGLLNSTHVEGAHSCGLLLGSVGSHNISVHHNLFAHNRNRNPLVKAGGLVDVVNNVTYNPERAASLFTDESSRLSANYVGNYFKRGANSTSNYSVDASAATGNGLELFIQGNIGPNRQSDKKRQALVVEPEDKQWIVNTRHNAPLVTTTTAFEAYDQVLATAGATISLDSLGRSVWRRDRVDERIVNDVKNGTGRYIDDPSQVGGWPQLSAGTAPTDSDHDGMPDEWERQYCLNPSNPSDGPADTDGDGYTNIEEYLNGTQPGSACAR